ncbi:hypothetical protein [Streptomyces roseolus]|uniref:hypothetical protein n=1 Tax=Streptomyces roseolus TaxID=67358 RepID=UPI0016779E61|nr:hypothetical protein [Streptomyces roseolus]
MAVCLLAAACGAAEEPEPERVTAERQCDDTLSPDAARALERVLETKRFEHDPRGGLERGANELVRDYKTARGLTLNPPVCRANPPTGAERVDLRFGLYVDDDLFGDVHPRGLHPYDMGVEAQSGPKKAYLFVRCVSPRFEGSDKRPARIRGTLVFNDSELPDTVPVREANLTILHSVTLAMARKLGCEDDAGLDEKPVFKPRPEEGA